MKKSIYFETEKESDDTSYSERSSRAKNMAATEAYRLARSNIEFSIIGSGCKVIIVTSADIGDGKTTTAINVAGAFAMQVDKKTLIIDCDLRKPRVAKYLKLKAKFGLTNYLCNGVELDKIIYKTDINGLSAIYSGDIPPNPAELLESRQMLELLEQLKQQFDYIVIDTPPINIVIDALSLAKHTDGIAVVIRENKTTYKDIDAMLDTFKIANIKLLGFILNGCKGSSSGSKYYHNKYKNYNYYG